MNTTGASILLEGGTIIDGSGAAPRRGAVLVRDGRVAALDTEAEQLAGDCPGVRRLGVRDCTVLPGLIDAHCHITFDEPASNDELFFHRREGYAALVAAHHVQKLVRAGVTGFLDPDVLFNLGVDLRDAIAAGIVVGPRMATGGNALLTAVGGTAGALIPDRGRRGYAQVVNGRDQIVAAVRRQIKSGVDWIKIHATGLLPRQTRAGELQVWSLEELRWACDAAHALGVPVAAHCRNASSTRDAARAGVDLILHATHMDEPALEAVVEAGAALVPSLTFQANLAEFGPRVGAAPALVELFRREIEDSSVMLRRAWDAGVPLLCGSESGFSLTPYGHWHARELEVFVRHLGLSPLQAISCATALGARALRMEGQVGQLKPGWLADLIVVQGDPLRDVTVLGDPRRLRHVLLGGVEVDLQRPLPQRLPLPGERVAQWSRQLLTRELAHGE
jgi:imidazolonepropionase-like amidohydrolase